MRPINNDGTTIRIFKTRNYHENLKKISCVIGLILFLPIVGITTLRLLGDGEAKMIERPKNSDTSSDTSINFDRDRNKADTEKALASLKQEYRDAKAQGEDKEIVSAMEELIESMEHYISSINPPKPE
jgi:hypothetical protein